MGSDSSTTSHDKNRLGGDSSRADKNRELIRNLYAFADAGEFEQVAQLCSSDYRLTRAAGGPVPGSWTGKDATAAIFRVFDSCGTKNVDIVEIIADGAHRVIGVIEASGSTPDGEPWQMPVLECFWIEDGKVTDIRPFYWDLVELRRIADLVGTA